MTEHQQMLDALESEIAELSAHISAATYRLVCCIREFDEHRGWEAQGAKSCAHWLNWRVGMSLNAARERIRVGQALAELPEISEAFRLGEVSYSKARAMTRVATPETEEYLLEVAKVGTASHVESLVWRFRRAGRAEDEVEQTNAQQKERYLRAYYDDDGMLVIEGRLPLLIPWRMVKMQGRTQLLQKISKTQECSHKA